MGNRTDLMETVRAALDEETPIQRFGEIAAIANRAWQ